MSLNMLRECKSALSRGVTFQPREQSEADYMLGGNTGVPFSTWLKDRGVKNIKDFCKTLNVDESHVKNKYKQRQQTLLEGMVDEYRAKKGMQAR